MNSEYNLTSSNSIVLIGFSIIKSIEGDINLITELYNVFNHSSIRSETFNGRQLIH